MLQPTPKKERDGTIMIFMIGVGMDELMDLR
jgi:hypothetical protein